MNKIVKISLILVIILFCMMTSVKATFTCKIDLKIEEKEYKKDELCVIEVVLANIQAERGIVAFGATLDYDKNSLELLRMEEKNDWARPSYNSNNGKIIMDKNGFATKDEVVVQIIFKVKETSKENLTIGLKNISIADGREESAIEDSNLEISLIKQEINTNEMQNQEQIADNETLEKETIQDKIKNGILPKTGDNPIILFIILIIGLFSIFFWNKIVIIDKKMEKVNK